MEVEGKKGDVWQISAGPASRSYADLFLKSGVALLGPGDPGPWKPDKSDDHYEGGYVRRFASEVIVGDTFLLRKGISGIRAIGLVAGDYTYLNQFDDVNGWDLQHCRRVRWFDLPQEHNFATPVFGANPPRLSRVSNVEVLDFVRRFLNSPPTHWQTSPLPPMPKEELLLEEIPVYLRNLVAQVTDVAQLYLNETDFGNYPSEDEMIVHFVVPFFYSLGWPPELVAIKWRYVDVAVFKNLPRTPENCCSLLRPNGLVRELKAH
ncbi:hypothetical protein L0156_05745 [bacterium]|nr:hypothetical protein [bacterium]